MNAKVVQQHLAEVIADMVNDDDDGSIVTDQVRLLEESAPVQGLVIACSTQAGIAAMLLGLDREDAMKILDVTNQSMLSLFTMAFLAGVQYERRGYAREMTL